MSKTYTYDGFTGTLYKICKHFNKKYDMIKYRMNNQNMTLEEAMEK